MNEAEGEITYTPGHNQFYTRHFHEPLPPEEATALLALIATHHQIPEGTRVCTIKLTLRKNHLP